MNVHDFTTPRVLPRPRGHTGTDTEPDTGPDTGVSWVSWVSWGLMEGPL